MGMTMRLLLCLGAVLAASAIAGCAGVAKTPGERQNAYTRALDMDMRQLADDWDTIWMFDRERRLTRWHIR
jgi:hypothetical protein